MHELNKYFVRSVGMSGMLCQIIKFPYLHNENNVQKLCHFWLMHFDFAVINEHFPIRAEKNLLYESGKLGYISSYYAKFKLANLQ